jgi:hypothetical protein
MRNVAACQIATAPRIQPMALSGTREASTAAIVAIATPVAT